MDYTVLRIEHRPKSVPEVNRGDVGADEAKAVPRDLSGRHPGSHPFEPPSLARTDIGTYLPHPPTWLCHKRDQIGTFPQLISQTSRVQYPLKPSIGDSAREIERHSDLGKIHLFSKDGERSNSGQTSRETDLCISSGSQSETNFLESFTGSVSSPRTIFSNLSNLTSSKMEQAIHNPSLPRGFIGSDCKICPPTFTLSRYESDRAVYLRCIADWLGFIPTEPKSALQRSVDTRRADSPHQRIGNPGIDSRFSKLPLKEINSDSLADRQHHGNVLYPEPRRPDFPNFVSSSLSITHLVDNERDRSGIRGPNTLDFELSRRRRESAKILASGIDASSVLRPLARAILPKTLLGYLKDFLRLLEFSDLNVSNPQFLVEAPKADLLVIEERLRISLADFLRHMITSKRPVDSLWSSLAFCWTLFFDKPIDGKGRLRLLLASARKTQVRTPRIRTGITQLDLKIIVGGMENSYLAWRDICMMSLASRLLLRPSELVSIKLIHVARNNEGYQILIKRKKNIFGGWVPYTLRPSPYERVNTIKILDTYLGHLGGTETFLFQSRTTGEALSVAQFSEMVKSRSAKVGLFHRSGHSLRIGGATWLASCGWPEAQIKALGNWNSDSYLRYIRVAQSCTSAL